MTSEKAIPAPSYKVSRTGKATSLPLESLVSESDCAELEKVIAAVEYYADPICTRTTMANHRYRINRNIK